MEKIDTTKYYGRTVQEMQPDEQPREKVQRFGAESLSDSELLAILLRTGTKGMNVVDTSRALLDHFNGLRNLSRQTGNHYRSFRALLRLKQLRWNLFLNCHAEFRWQHLVSRL
jgi:DNA repair protein RadC